MSKPKILVQLDSDPQASVFDGVVAVDAGVNHLFRHSHVTPSEVRNLVYGAMFTRHVDDLRQTAIFVGGSSVAVGEHLLEQVTESFFGPMRVSVMLDANGANTTAAAAVLAAARHVDLSTSTAVVLAGTGSVGERVARLLAGSGATVRVASRSLDRASAVCDRIGSRMQDAQLEPWQTSTPKETAAALAGAQVVIAAGAAGVLLLDSATRTACESLQTVIDLNAVPPLGIEGIESGDNKVEREGALCYGAIGVGGLKMKIHKSAVASLFDSNNVVLDAEEILAIGRTLERSANEG